MNFKASTKVAAVDLVKLQSMLVPRLVAVTSEAQEYVTAEAQAIVPVDTGDLLLSIGPGPIELVGTVVSGTVEATAPYAAYVEFGTGQRGAASPGAGEGPYSETWPGMPAQPYMRPALDTARPEILAAYEKHGFKVV